MHQVLCTALSTLLLCQARWDAEASMMKIECRFVCMCGGALHCKSHTHTHNYTSSGLDRGVSTHRVFRKQMNHRHQSRRTEIGAWVLRLEAAVLVVGSTRQVECRFQISCRLSCLLPMSNIVSERSNRLCCMCNVVEASRAANLSRRPFQSQRVTSQLVSERCM